MFECVLQKHDGKNPHGLVKISNVSLPWIAKSTDIALKVSYMKLLPHLQKGG